MVSMLTQLSVRRYAHHHALLIVFLSSAIWGVSWVPMRYAEAFGISELRVVTLFHVLPAIAILPFIARAYITDCRHRLVSFIAGGLLAGTAAFVMGDVFPETHRLIAVLPVAFLA